MVTMMTGDLDGKPLESAGGGLARDLILEILSEGFASNVKLNLEERIRSFLLNKRLLKDWVFNTEEQKKIVECIYDLQRMGQMGQLRGRTYSEPRKWMRGGRVTKQFGCCYNYAVDKNRNPSGIIRDEEVDPLPPLFKQMIQEDGGVACSCFQDVFLTAAS